MLLGLENRRSKVSAMASAMAIVSEYWSAARRKVGLRMRLNVRFLQGSLAQWLPCCPMPAVWLRAHITVNSSTVLRSRSLQ